MNRQQANILESKTVRDVVEQMAELQALAEHIEVAHRTDTEGLDRQLAYWRQQLADAPRLLELPTDRPRPPVQTHCGARQHTLFPSSLAQALNELSRREGTTLFMTLLAAFQVLLFRYTGQADIVVGSPTANRTRVESEQLIGFFINMLVLRTNLSGNPTFHELLQRVREVVLSAYAHQELPFEKLVEELCPERTLNYPPLFQVVFHLRNVPERSVELADVQTAALRDESGTSQFDLTFALHETSDGLEVEVEYNTDLFDGGRVQRMLGHYQTLLQGIIGTPERRTSELEILTEAERHQLLVEWNDTGRSYPHEQCVHQLIEAQVERTPEAIAVVLEDQQLTYCELNARANQLAHYLRTLGVGPEELVGICMERSPEMMVGLLGILKAGGAYVPLDGHLPKDRLRFLLEDTQVPVVLTQLHLRERLPHGKATVVCLDGEWDWAAPESKVNPLGNVTPSNLAYVLYTSGTTGRPKGTLIEHRSVVNYLGWVNDCLLDKALDGLLATTKLSFDASLKQLLAPLVRGRSVCLVREEAVSEPAVLLRAVEQQENVGLNCVPSLWNALLEELRARRPGIPREYLTALFVGGERLTKELVEKSFAAVPNLHLWNLYGPTEATANATAARIRRGERVTIGRPIANTQVYILDVHLQPVPIGVTGELYIGGVGVARGYLHHPELTSEKFIAHSFAGEPPRRLYKTGDLARYLPDGNIDFVGRIDNQVKVRGFRIELEEIETILAQHPGVREAVVLAREDSPGGKRLVAYVVVNQQGTPTVNELRSFLKETLPEYMLPSAYVVLENLPLIPNGKIDRSALPAPDYSRADLARRYVAPRNLDEELLAGIWAEVLKVEKVGVHENFFELSGHSLLATQVISRICDTFQVEVPLHTLFEAPTVAGLALAITRSVRTEPAPPTLPLRPVSRTNALPLSFAQQRLWFLDQFEPHHSFYNISQTVRLQGQLNTAALCQALNLLVARHETLRTTFIVGDREPVQVIAEHHPLELPVIDLQIWPEAQREAEALRLATAEAQCPFDLAQGSLVRAQLVQLGAADHLLLLTMHHIISDGWSLGVFWQELTALYNMISAGQPSPLSELPIQYVDFAVWQRQWMQGDVLDQHVAYWRRQLVDAPPILTLPTDRPRLVRQTYRGARQTFPFPPALVGAIETLSRQEGVTLFMTLLGAFKVLLARYSGQRDIIVGSPIANRHRTELEGLIGFFVNTLVLRTDLSGNPTFRELLQRVREVCLGAYAHQDLPFEKLVEELHPQRELSHPPIVQIVFAVQNILRQPLALTGVQSSLVAVESGTAKFDLSLFVWEEETGNLTGEVEYNTDLFDEVTITRLIRHYQTLLEGLVTNPDAPIATLPLLTPAERQQLLVEWNTTQRDYPAEQCVHQLFEAQVQRTPDATSVIYEGQKLTYRELNSRANQLAHYLRKQGIGADSLVGLCLERSVEMVIAMLAVLKAGGAYVPLDPSYPQERLAFMLADTQAPVVLTQCGWVDILPRHGTKLVCLDRDWATVNHESTENLPVQTTADNLAYVIYTSGSTGHPKGVEVPHRGIVRLVCSADYVQFDSSQIFLQLAPLSFDAATFELWGAFLHGATCVLFPGRIPSPIELGNVLRKYSVNPLWLTASLFNTLIDQASEALANVRQLLIGGEALSVAHVRRALTLLPHTQLINGYGPTESTTFACTYAIPRYIEDTATSIPIGRPIANTSVYILDAHLNPVPAGVAGELYLGEDGLARGYLNRPELTAEKFIPHPFSTEPGGRLYRTGDLARYRPDGNIEFLGRIDSQVKLRGFRIELGEIKAALTQHPEVRETAVLVREDSPGDKRVVAYVVPRGSSVSVSELRRFLTTKLPEYMIPAVFVMLDALPVTPNGKIDRKALPCPDHTRPEIVEPYLAARTPTEELLVGIWTEALKLERLGIRDNFFDLGGYSLLATMVISRINHQFHIEVPLRSMFESQTVAAMAKLIEEQREQPVSSEVLDRTLSEIEALSEEEVETLLTEKADDRQTTNSCEQMISKVHP